MSNIIPKYSKILYRASMDCKQKYPETLEPRLFFDCPLALLEKFNKYDTTRRWNLHKLLAAGKAKYDQMTDEKLMALILGSK